MPRPLQYLAVAGNSLVTAAVNVDTRDLVEVTTIPAPETPSILASMPLPLLAYYIAVLRGTNVDQPRNPVRPVTLESRNSGAHTETQRHRDEVISVPLCLCVKSVFRHFEVADSISSALSPVSLMVR